MFQQLIKQDIPQYFFHTNPSRRKIPYPPCRRQGKQCSHHCRKQCPQSHQHLNSTANLSHITTQSTASLVDTSMQQHQHLLDDNRYLKKQLKELKTTNKTLLDKLEDKERELVRADSEYRVLVMQVNNQMERASCQIKGLDESKIRHKGKENTNNHQVSRIQLEELSTHSQSDVSRRSRSRDNLVKIKQIFEEMDFKEVERIASLKKKKRGLE